MTDVNVKIVNRESFDASHHDLSATDMHNLEHYVNQQHYPLIYFINKQENDQENSSVDFSITTLTKNKSQSFDETHEYHYQYRHRSKPLQTLNNSNILSLKVVTCGMQKNRRLPIPYENFSLNHGRFGDDAGFTMQNAKKNFLGISDGAGGNSMYGYDPRLFAESLMRHCSDLAHTDQYSTSEPKRLLCHAFDRVQMENCFGSATACVIGIDCRTGRLYSVNIGDSGYVIVRQGCVVYRSRSQEMNGDCPRQLDVYPWTAALRGHGLNYTQISSSDAICQTFELQLNDIIILSTDGLFDNVTDYIIEQILSRSRSLKHAAKELVTHAIRFYIKPDDILIIMAQVANDLVSTE